MAYSSIVKPTDYFNTKLYTGNGSSNALTGVGFQPDLVWVKSRSQANSHVLFDAIRTFAGGKEIQSNNTGAEGASDSAGYGYISAVSADGFTAQVGTSAGDYTNVSSQNYVGWNWLGANGTASNSNGSITSTVSANTTAGFSIVSYTGTGSSPATIGHGLGATPDMVIIKDRDASKAWVCYHSAIGATKGIFLEQTSAANTSSTYFNNTAPTSSVFTIADSSHVNTSSDKYIAYCFAGKKGYSKFGSFTGNNNADGVFVYTGFKPAWVMTKSSNQGGTGYDWVMFDNKRNPFNVSDAYIDANLNAAEVTSGRNEVDFLSNGFKCRSSYGDLNSNYQYIYMAFAENPFVTAGTKAAGTAK